MLSETRAIRNERKRVVYYTAIFTCFFFFLERQKKILTEWTEWLLCSKFILPHGDITVTQRLQDCGVLNSWGSHVWISDMCMTLCAASAKHRVVANLFFLIVHFQTDTKIDDEIIHVRCVLLKVYPRTLKERHSIRVWSWEIRWGLNWINSLAVEWWPPANETGISNVSSSGHRGWVVSLL